MKTLILTLTLLFTLAACKAESPEASNIKKTIIASAKAGDNNDVGSLEKYLDQNYRIVMNQQFGSTEISIVPRSLYIEKISSKEWGGDTRKVDISNLVVNGNIASAQVLYTGQKMIFQSIVLLIKDVDENWKLISEYPNVK